MIISILSLYFVLLPLYVNVFTDFIPSQSVCTSTHKHEEVNATIFLCVHAHTITSMCNSKVKFKHQDGSTVKN